jgi:hypothetical protein
MTPEQTWVSICGDLRRRAYRMKACLPAYARSSLPKLMSRNDYLFEDISPAGASGAVTGLYEYKPRSSAVAPGFGPLFVTP